jgi:hypothetical protein
VLGNTGVAVPSPNTWVGASRDVALFGTTGASSSAIVVTRHVFADGGTFPTGSATLNLNNAAVSELLVGSVSGFYVVGNTSASNATLSGVPIPNDGGLSDPFVAKLGPTLSIIWIKNFGGAADETSTHAFLTDDQLLVAGTCSGTATSSLCNGNATHWIVSLSP